MAQSRLFFESLSGSRWARVVALAAGLGVLAGCAQPQPRMSAGRTKEYFPEGKYGKASPRAVEIGEPVPKGGGRYLVGKPYSVAGRTYYPGEKSAGFTQTGTASWYGSAFHGRRTANGEIYDMASVTAAHPTMPLPSYARVTNLANGKSIIVRVNDRGPYHGGRVMDLSQKVAELLEYKHLGTARVKIDYVGKADVAGSDDRKLIATLTTGRPAQLPGYETPTEAGTMLATAEPAPAPRQSPLRPAPAAAPVVSTPAPSASMAAAPNALRPSLEGEEEEGGATVAAALPTVAPSPPARPFDLGTIPGAAVPITARGASSRQREAATFFAPDATLAGQFEKRGPFVGVTDGFRRPDTDR
jgi:rare lipoprotein A